MLRWARQVLKFNLEIQNHIRNYSIENEYKKISKSYWHERGTFQFLNITLGDLVDKTADSYGDKIAFAVPYQNINKTFTQFKKDVDQLAIGLIGLGLQKNDRIALWSTNRYEWIVTQFATSRAGLILRLSFIINGKLKVLKAITKGVDDILTDKYGINLDDSYNYRNSVSLNPALRAAELEYSLNKVQCKAIIAAEKFKTLSLYDTLCEVIPEITNSKPGQIQSQKVKSLQHVITLTNKSLPGTHIFNEILKNDGSENVKLFHERKKTIEPDDATAILFTSGTTGNPKGVVLTHFHLVNQSVSAGKRVGYDKEPPTLCLQLPLFHVFGYVLGPVITLMHGGKCVIPSEYFDSISALKTIQEEKCSIVYWVPTMLYDILKHLSSTNFNLSSLKKIALGAAPIPDSLIQMLKQKINAEILNGYGITETSSGICLGNYLTYSGRPIEHIEVKIVDIKGNIVPINTKGEILCRSPYTFLGYWEDKEKTAEVLDSARWYHTGDVGSMDENGNVCVTGRTKDCIIRGGENIYPQEVENFLLSHSAIAEVYVVGVPDSRMGEELCCCIHLKPNQKSTEKDIKEFCVGKISDFKIPKYVLFCETFPKTESGKIQKHKLQERCISLLKL